MTQLARRVAQPHAVEQETNRRTNTFLILWLGQLVSTIGSGMTAVALGIHIYQQTGSATNFALIFLAGALPRTLLSPVAGVLADRWDRRRVMMLADIGAGLSVIGLLDLVLTGQLQLWPIYAMTVATAAFGSLRVPAYTAGAVSLVPKAQIGRVGGLLQLSDALGQVVAPVVAGALMSRLHLNTVLAIDGLTFLVSLLTLLAVRFPAVTHTATGQSARGSLRQEVQTGWRYLVERPGLMGLLVVFAIGNFFVGNAQALLTPMILSFASPGTLGALLSAGGAGMVSGGILLSVWGGGRRRVYTVLGAYMLMGLSILLTGLIPSAEVVAVTLFFAYFSLPLIIGGSQAILASKVARHLQGRVFSLRIMLVTASFTLAYLTAGLLADRVFEPLLVVGGPLAGSVGQIIGVGAGRGIGLMFVLMGLGALLASAGGFAYAPLRQVDIDVPDAAEG